MSVCWFRLPWGPSGEEPDLALHLPSPHVVAWVGAQPVLPEDSDRCHTGVGLAGREVSGTFLNRKF